MDKRAGALALGALVACSTVLHGRIPESPANASSAAPSGYLSAGLPHVPDPAPAAEHTIRVALLTSASSARISATGTWRLYQADGESFVARGAANETWRVEHNGSNVRAVRSDGVPTVWEPRALVARADDPSALMVVNGKRYVGELRLVGTDYGLQVVERVPVETYLRGVVPLEIGDRNPGDSAAIQAQAVSARSYAYTHLADAVDETYDVTAGVTDQAYGGVDAETRVGNAAVDATAGIVVTFGGRVVNAPYHSTCGGETAGAEEVWHSPAVPYLRSVSDRIPGTDRYYCDISPHFKWTRTLTRAELNQSVARYLARYTAVPGGDPGLVRDLTVTGHTASGRVATLDVRTTLGSFTLRGD
ncbi:MAG: SpoIID/LytB domain-containing protein, partial [Gemmatimonadaceae bacterium]